MPVSIWEIHVVPSLFLIWLELWGEKKVIVSEDRFIHTFSGASTLEKVKHHINSLLVTGNRYYIITHKLGFNHTLSSICLITRLSEPQIFHMWKPGLPTGCHWVFLAPMVGGWVSQCGYIHKVYNEILIILFDFVLTIYAFSLPGIPDGCSMFVIS